MAQGRLPLPRGGLREQSRVRGPYFPSVSLGHHPQAGQEGHSMLHLGHKAVAAGLPFTGSAVARGVEMEQIYLPWQCTCCHYCYDKVRTCSPSHVNLSGPRWIHLS